MDPDSPLEYISMIKVWYFGLTTLSTIGFGDFLPMSGTEKLIIACVMLVGVLVFSFIMTKFVDMLMLSNSLEFTGDYRELSKFISTLMKYN